jgi:hypothetical protein
MLKAQCPVRLFGFLQGDAVLGDEVVVTGRAVGFFRIRTNRSAGVQDLVRKLTRNRAARVQKLRHPNDVAGKEKQSLADIKGFS